MFKKRDRVNQLSQGMCTKRCCQANFFRDNYSTQLGNDKLSKSYDYKAKNRVAHSIFAVCWRKNGYVNADLAACGGESEHGHAATEREDCINVVA